jgi:hypothetical protein
MFPVAVLTLQLAFTTAPVDDQLVTVVLGGGVLGFLPVRTGALEGFLVFGAVGFGPGFVFAGHPLLGGVGVDGDD